MYPVSSIVFPVRLHLALFLLAAGIPALMQAQNRNLILLDPAHGGQDRGATLNGTLEKDLTLSFANILRSLLAARNFTVVSTRDTDLPPNTPLLPADQRAGMANHLRPGICLILHATASGNGVHLATSPLTPTETSPASALPWETAQTAFLNQSQRLANNVGLALQRNKLPVTISPAALRPLDHLTCPAFALEIAPLSLAGGRSTPPTDAVYQRRIAEAVAFALLNWRNSLPLAGSAP